jgi:NCS1 family nucleobase:cation symporter-1
VARRGAVRPRHLDLLLRLLALNIAVIWRGIETIKFLEGIGAPFMLGIGLLLLWWITGKAGGSARCSARPASSTHGENSCDSSSRRSPAWSDSGPPSRSTFPISRATPNRSAQAVGQALGLARRHDALFVHRRGGDLGVGGLFGEAIWDPVVLLGRFNQPVVASIALIALLVATLNTNVAANVVSPSNDFSNLNPRLISFRTGGLITGVVGI